MEKFYELVDAKKQEWIARLAEAVAIDSVSAEPERRGRCVDMMHWAKERMERLGIKTELHDIGMQNHPSGVQIPLPPVLTGIYGTDANKRTLVVYGHLDVQPAAREDGWNTEPFVLEEIDGKLYGRGSTDDKAPALAWLWSLECFQELNIECPVNIKFVFEGMEESGSEGLDTWIYSHPEFFKDVDFTCISDNYWLGPRKPCITFGLRGLCAFEVSVECATKDLHSGVYGGPVREGMVDLVKLMGSLLNEKGAIAIEGINDEVLPITKEEIDRLKVCDFDPREYADEIGARQLRYNEKWEVLAARWRFPSLSLHGIEGAWSGKGTKTVIPKQVIGKFSIRMVPGMTVERTSAIVSEHIKKEVMKLNSPNKITCKMTQGAPAWLADTNDDNYVAARLAVEEVFDCVPDYTREGGSIPVAGIFSNVTKKSVLLLPIGASDDSAHSQNEKINVTNYIEGIKLLGTYLTKLPKKGETLAKPNNKACC